MSSLRDTVARAIDCELMRYHPKDRDSKAAIVSSADAALAAIREQWAIVDRNMPTQEMQRAIMGQPIDKLMTGSAGAEAISRYRAMIAVGEVKE